MATTTHREVERKLDVDPDAQVPDLTGVPGVARVAEPVVHTLAATYFDTPDLALSRARVTLRRRTGGDDGGWHLKTPAGDGERDEHHLPLGRPTQVVPPELLDPVRVHVRDRALAPVAELATRRTVHRLLGEDGTVLAELCDDVVTARSFVLTTAERPREPVASTWREWEVELVDGDTALLAAAVEVLLGHGARPAGSASKLGRALGAALPQAPAALPTRARRDEPAAGLVVATLEGFRRALVAQDPRVRVDADDSVHKMRVATRQLRSALATFRATLDRDVTDAVRGELSWLADLLGHARDAEVLRARCARLVTALPPHLLLGPVQARLDDHLRERYETGHRHVLVALDSPRYLALLDRLDSLVARPPLTDAAGEPVGAVAAAALHRDWRRVARAEAAAAEPGADREELLHDVRKAAKRLRYAAEATRPALGGRAKRLAARAEDVQEVLGEHHDDVVTQEFLVHAAERAHRDGENGFTYGLLHAALSRDTAVTEEHFATAFAALRREVRRAALR